MSDEKRLSELLYDERGYHFKVLADEYQKMADEFAARSRAALESYKAYRDGKHVVFPCD